VVEIMVAFITGLTTGGLSCLAVQGGLLASSLAQQIELDLQSPGAPNRKGQKAPAPHLARPILLFLAAKVMAYTLLGALLGALGSMLQLTTAIRAGLLIAIGIFMVGNALRMLNVHPIFRFFNLEPPPAVTRFIRRTAKGNASWLTPVSLGMLTVFIPCGITQTMMAVALGMGDPWNGAAIMFAFTLGTSPVFFFVSYFATKLGSTLEKHFMRVVAVVVLVLGLVSVETGLNLAGSPYSISNMVRSAQTTSTQPDNQPSGTIGAGSALTLYARNDGYEPVVLHAPADKELTLNLVTDNTRSCSRAFVIPALNVEKLLPATGVVGVYIPPQPKDSTMLFSCSMGMYSGKIVFDR
jgi:sulfite exporter TauE/SafE